MVDSTVDGPILFKKRKLRQCKTISSAACDSDDQSNSMLYKYYCIIVF